MSELDNVYARIKTNTKECTLTCNPRADLGGEDLGGEDLGEEDLGEGAGSNTLPYKIVPYDPDEGDDTVNNFLDYISHFYSCDIKPDSNYTGTISYPSSSSSSLMSSSSIQLSSGRQYKYTVIHASTGGGGGQQYIGLGINGQDLILLFSINQPRGFNPVGWVNGENGLQVAGYNNDDLPWSGPKMGGLGLSIDRSIGGGREEGDKTKGIRTKGRNTKGRNTKGRKTKGRKTKRRKTKRRKH